MPAVPKLPTTWVVPGEQRVLQVSNALFWSYSLFHDTASRADAALICTDILFGCLLRACSRASKSSKIWVLGPHNCESDSRRDGALGLIFCEPSCACAGAMSVKWMPGNEDIDLTSPMLISLVFSWIAVLCRGSLGLRQAPQICLNDRSPVRPGFNRDRGCQGCRPLEQVCNCTRGRCQ